MLQCIFNIKCNLKICKVIIDNFDNNQCYISSLNGTILVPKIMKKKIIPIILLSSLLASGFAVVIRFNNKEGKNTYAYDVGSLPSTIYVSPSTDNEIRNYYSNLNNLDESERKGTNLLKNLKDILKKNQVYYSYDVGNGKKIWQMYEIIDRDLEKSPYTDLGSKYNAKTQTITGYSYGSSANYPGTDPYIRALYVDRSVENHMLAWHEEGNNVSNHGDNKEWHIDREHLWPKSQGFNLNGTGGARGDPMHLWPADSDANSTPHNDNLYGYVDLNRTDKITYGKWSYANNNLSGLPLTTGTNINPNQVVFEPQDSDKGDIARSIFYMVARYNYLSGSDTDGIDTDNPNLELLQTNQILASYTSSTTVTGKMGILTDLLAWHKADPVDEYEIRRNNLLFKNYTKNRNPFIDYPEWADYIWGTATYNGRQYVSYNSTPTGYASPNTDVINGYKTGVSVTGVSLNKSSLTLHDGDTYALKATVSPSDATNKDVTWSSSNSNVVSVDSTGKITANNSGNAVITVTTDDGGFTATCNVTVEYEITSITATCDKSFHVGDLINKTDIVVKDNKNNLVTDFYFGNSGYMFKYTDAPSGGAEVEKTFSVSYGDIVANFNVNVSREKFEGGSVTDLLNRDFTGVTSTIYDSWTKTSNNGVVYEGHSAGGNESIQLRTALTSSTYYSGIVTTTSIGNFKKIVVDWNPSTAAARKIQIFGKNTPYSGTSDLYDNSTRGALLGEIGTTATTYTATDDYAYIGIKSASGALWLKSIQIEYGGGGEITPVSLSNYIMYEDTTNQCVTKTDVAIGYFNSLTDQEEFMTSEDYVIATARTRFNAWLAHEGKEVVPNNNGYVISNSSIYLLEASAGEDNNMILMVLIASSTLIAFTTLLIIKKKRRK